MKNMYVCPKCPTNTNPLWTASDHEQHHKSFHPARSLTFPPLPPASDEAHDIWRDVSPGFTGKATVDANENFARALSGATCYAYALPTKTEGRSYRAKVQTFYKTIMANGESQAVTHAQALDALQRLFPFYSRETLAEIVGQRQVEEKASHRHRCACGCKTLIERRKTYASDKCRMRAKRRQARAASISSAA